MEDYKLNILKTLYSQQQSTAHILRERMSKIATGAISIFIVIDGWLIANAKNLSCSQLLMLNFSVVVIMVVSVYGVHARYKEFSAVASMIVRIETAMKIYEVGLFIENEPLYPLEHTSLGSDDYEHSKSIFYSQAAIVIIFGVLSLALGLGALA
jgi:hypothetical protein